MAVAAATAVIAPATFLAAPAAYADPSPATSESATATADPAPSDTATTSPAPSDIATASPAPSDTATTTTSPSPSDSATTSPSPSPSTTAPDDEDPDEEFECEEGDVKVSLGGFPNKIVAGSGWKNFTFNVKNSGKTDIESLLVYSTAIYEGSLEGDTADKLVDKYAHFEYKDPESGEWINDFEGAPINNGMFFGEFALDAGKKVTIDLRVKIDKGAPAGDGLAIAAGSYDNATDDDETFECYESGQLYPFTIVKAGSNPGDIDDSKPNGEKPGSDVKPQGDAKEIKVTGNLAETGSDSQLPVIGAIGGITILAGAGVVFAMKRRKGNAAA
ncbi:LPXTG cell wall anchor domain-containing protein [Streptomyces sp. NBC_00390]|uniref:LAETG motif-containing sortase-dependent surface protein n=1 Tax=Streptomyces sp. NBC_00390 TaxID=2975736 RepID=UPI002E1ED936